MDEQRIYDKLDQIHDYMRGLSIEQQRLSSNSDALTDLFTRHENEDKGKFQEHGANQILLSRRIQKMEDKKNYAMGFAAGVGALFSLIVAYILKHLGIG